MTDAATPGKPDASLLAAAGAASAAPSATPGVAAPAAAVRNWHREAADIIAVVAGMRHVFPSLAPIYTTQTCEDLASAWAPILERHNIDFGRFMIYVTAGGVTLPVVVSTVQAVRGDIRAAKSGARAAPAAPAPATPDADPPAAPAPAAAPNVDLEVHNPPMAPAGPALESAPPI